MPWFYYSRSMLRWSPQVSTNRPSEQSTSGPRKIEGVVEIADWEAELSLDELALMYPRDPDAGLEPEPVPVPDPDPEPDTQMAMALGEADVPPPMDEFASLRAAYMAEPWGKLAVEAGFDPVTTEASARHALRHCAEKIALLQAACNQSRLALAGYVSSQSAIDQLDAVLGGP